MSPKEPRRSNRRSLPSASTSKSSGSPSPDASNIQLPPPKDPKDNKDSDAPSAARSAAPSSSNTNSSRSKRSKDDHDDHFTPSHRRTNSITSQHTAVPSSSSAKRSNGKRRGKDTANQESHTEASPPPMDPPPQDPQPDPVDEEEDAGITRCVCEDEDGEASEFMIQCETCKVWQHGPCMGFATEADSPQGDYYCEQCRPEDHAELLRKLSKRARHSSEKSHHQSRASRSHSPTHVFKQAQAKRRNTMNSRDAAYEEAMLRAALDESAAEAAASGIDTSGDGAGVGLTAAEVTVDETVESAGAASRRKRKRVEDEAAPTKRKRSASSAEEVPILAAITDARGETSTDAPASAVMPPPAQPATSSKGSARAKRGGGRKNAGADAASVDGDDVKKHPNQYTYRGKTSGGNQQRRAPASAAQSPALGGSTHEHGTRRGGNRDSNSGAAGSGTGSGSNRNAHHYQAYYNATQLPLFTSWGLPDYLAHLQSILPSEVPPPLVIRGAVSFFREGETTSTSGGGENTISSSTSSTTVATATVVETDKTNATGSLSERGVKVKWPAKRMSVADMNKRVRALLEWVGREQACFSDRERRKEALERELKGVLPIRGRQNASGAEAAGDVDGEVTDHVKLVVDTNVPNDVQQEATASASSATVSAKTPTGDTPTPMLVDSNSGDQQPSLTTSPVAEEPKAGIPTHDRTSEPTTAATLSAPSSATVSTPPRLGSGNNASNALLAHLARQSTAKMMEELMEELISFQERFGPGAKSSREKGGHGRVIAAPVS